MKHSKIRPALKVEIAIAGWLVALALTALTNTYELLCLAQNAFSGLQMWAVGPTLLSALGKD